MSDHTSTTAPGADTSGRPDALTVYTTDWCPYCARLKKLLGERGIAYTEVDVDVDAAAAGYVEGVNGGNRVVPTVLYSDGTTATNPGASEVAAKLAELTAG